MARSVFVVASLLASVAATAGTNSYPTCQPLHPTNYSCWSRPIAVVGCGGYGYIPPEFVRFSNDGLPTSTLFTDRLPNTAKITSVRVVLPLSRGNNSGLPSRMAVSINSQAIGSAIVSTPMAGCGGGFADYVFQADFPDGMPGYVAGGVNTLYLTVSEGFASVQLAGWQGHQVEVTYTSGVEVSALSGSDQTGAVGSGTELPLRAKLTSYDPSEPVAGKTVKFDVTAEPATASGTAVGLNESSTTRTYSVVADASGIAQAVHILGDKEGSYTVKASSSLSVTGTAATFTATAKKPASVQVTAGDPIVPVQPSFIVPPPSPVTFYAIGLDAAGQKIGPTRSDWSVTVGTGSGTVSPAAKVSSTQFQPVSAGSATLSANPVTSGIATQKAAINITGLYLTAEGSFDPASPVDQLPNFVPGSKLDGTSLPIPGVPTQPLQTVSLHVLTPAGATGTVRFDLSEVTRYPGVAMNYPILNPSDAYDLDFGAGAQSKTQNFAASGDTWTTLYVYDYAAYGKLKVTITSGRTVYQLATVTLPKDANANGLPDGGWNALANSATGAMNHVSDAYVPTSDEDNYPLVSGVPAQGITGDGLSTAEEYRGFVVRGAHRRLHPAGKDVFIVIRSEDDAVDDRVTELPLTVHEIRPNEAEGEFGPIVNPNRTSVPGSSLQRAVFARNRLKPPLYQRTDGVISADFQAGGWTFQQGDDIDLIDGAASSLALLQSPNETLVAEIFDWAFWRHYISYGPNAIRETNVAPTDTDDPANHAIYGENDWLQSTPNSANVTGDDFHTATIFTVCGSATGRPWRTLTVDEVIDMYKGAFLHEVAHGIDVDHDLVECSQSIMSGENVMPVVRSLTPNDLAQIRVHRKHN